MQELAERRTRQTVADRRLIAERTAKSLRVLATLPSVYRQRSLARAHAGRRVNLTDYLTSPPEEMGMEDDDDDDGLDAMGDPEPIPSYLEGARVNSDLYDAYASQGWTSHPMGSSLARRSQSYSSVPIDPPESSTVADSALPPLGSRSRSSGWGLPSATTFMSSSGSVSRQPTVRRPIRSRTVDFNDYSTRRRSTFRNSTAASEDSRTSEEIPNSLSTWVSGPTSDGPQDTGATGARRFFPFSRRRPDAPVMPWPDNAVVTTGPASSPEPISFRPWRSGSGPPPLIPASSLESESWPHAESERSPFPRLRRGGVRPPESMLSRHASPVTGEADDTTTPIVISIQREAHRDAASSTEATGAAVPVSPPTREEQS